MKKKILVVASTFPRWKDDTDPPFVYELSKRLTSFDVTILAPHYPGAKRFEVMDGMNVYRFKYFFERFEKLAGSGGILPTLNKNKLYYLQVPFFMLAEFFALRKLIRKIKPDVIHAHWIIPQGFLVALCKKKSKLVITTHGGDIFGIKRLNPLKKWTINRSDGLTVVSNAIKQEVEKLGVDKTIPVKVLSMGVDFSRFSPSNYNQDLKKKYNITGPFLLFVGRLTEKKGVRYLIEAMPAILAAHPTTKLMIIGSGGLQEDLEELTKILNVDASVIFTGAIQNAELPKYYATADIFIGPSVIAKGGDTEGFGLVFVEAIASGCIAIGTDLPAIADIIVEEQTGFVVKQQNPHSIAQTVIRLLLDPSLDLIRKKARHHILERFDWTSIAEKYTEVLI